MNPDRNSSPAVDENWNVTRGYGGAKSLKVYRKLTAVDSPTERWVFLDENPYSINDGYFAEDPVYTTWVDYPASYHAGAGGLAFCDGHAQIRRWKDNSVLTLKVENPPALAPNPTGCTDLSWLQALSTQIIQ